MIRFIQRSKKKTTILKVTIQVVKIANHFSCSSGPIISLEMLDIIISAKRNVVPATININTENIKDIKITYILYRNRFPLQILLAAIPMRFIIC